MVSSVGVVRNHLFEYRSWGTRSDSWLANGRRGMRLAAAASSTTSRAMLAWRWVAHPPHLSYRRPSEPMARLINDLGQSEGCRPAQFSAVNAPLLRNSSAESVHPALHGSTWGVGSIQSGGCGRKRH